MQQLDKKVKSTKEEENNFDKDIKDPSSQKERVKDNDNYHVKGREYTALSPYQDKASEEQSTDVDPSRVTLLLEAAGLTVAVAGVVTNSTSIATVGVAASWCVYIVDEYLRSDK